VALLFILSAADAVVWSYKIMFTCTKCGDSHAFVDVKFGFDAPMVEPGGNVMTQDSVICGGDGLSLGGAGVGSSVSGVWYFEGGGVSSPPVERIPKEEFEYLDEEGCNAMYNSCGAGVWKGGKLVKPHLYASPAKGDDLSAKMTADTSGNLKEYKVYHVQTGIVDWIYGQGASKYGTYGNLFYTGSLMMPDGSEVDIVGEEGRGEIELPELSAGGGGICNRPGDKMCHASHNAQRG
jgi:hypothetical protein